ncbi:hypothetical protein Xsto_03267 [Xenorhabdus stockiae]|uniref:Uncharacterized protein n=1 Tax=Xenorhabdus stockiae TaxID=351614 RepID=A0A2D0KL45_9GAMM|nr:hypothetical protein Xsto_03267 [Xenorhabdus stockiae]
MYNSKLFPFNLFPLLCIYSHAILIIGYIAMINYFIVYLQWNEIVSIVLPVIIWIFFRIGITIIIVTLLGILGAVNVWHFSWLESILLFTSPEIGSIIFMLFLFSSERG